VAQRRVPVLPGDTPDTLAARVAAAERELYPWVVQRVAELGLEWLGRVARPQVPQHEGSPAGQPEPGAARKPEG